MFANLSKKTGLWILLLLISFTFCFDIKAQDCPQTTDFSFSPDNPWDEFPDFKLPFKVVYGGHSQLYQPGTILNRGFSHISSPNGIDFLDKRQRAYILYGVAELEGQPWREHKSPYGNDLNAYEAKWDNDLDWARQNNKGTLDFDIFCLDIEKLHKSADSILAIKNMSFIPDDLKALSDEEFIIRYKQDMQNLYAYAATYIKSRVNTEIFTSYGDPVIFNTFDNIQGPDWHQWQTDPNLLYYINYDFEKKSPGGGFYNEINWLAPSAYFYYDYPHIFAGEYLSYLLFQIEANKARSDKKQMVFLWNLYSFNPQFVGNPIRPWMSEAMAIFPLFSGAEGMWLWEDPFKEPNINGYYYFTRGLYRLSKFKDFFEGDYLLINTISARDYNENKLPIWRGILKNDRMLVAAHNPWAKSEKEEVKLQISYGSLQKEIRLKGYETFLCDFPATQVTGKEPEFGFLSVYPNPTTDYLNYRIKAPNSEKLNITLWDELGRKLFDTILDENKNFYEGQINVTDFKAKKLILKVENRKFKLSETVILLQ